MDGILSMPQLDGSLLKPTLAIEVVGPRILLVDDDPIFCRVMESTAKKNRINLTVAKNMGEVIQLHGKSMFDAAVLDYQFGDLTAYQVGHFLAENTPIILTSNHQRSEVDFRDWPFDIRDFVAKSVGNLGILNRALEAAGGQARGQVQVQAAPHAKRVWGSGIAILVSALCLGILLGRLTVPNMSPRLQPIVLERWDGLQIGSGDTRRS